MRAILPPRSGGPALSEGTKRLPGQGAPPVRAGREANGFKGKQLVWQPEGAGCWGCGAPD